ncbi:MAG TPA: hypothetical protein VFL17_01505, partial [Anaerolineae bacterium]|nr:hypothetical protein [Anaerolineae bacterium]
MKDHLRIGIVVTGALLMLVGLVVVACTPAGPTATTAPTTPAGPAATTAPTTPPEPELAGDAVRGGQLYDTWWAVAPMEEEEHKEGEEHEAAGPTTDQPLWKTQTTNTRTGEETWRCKECHGWDYRGVDGAYGSGSHKTGFVGIFNAQSKPAAELLAILKGSTNPDHDFSKDIDEQGLID